ncbi:MAG: hypothetical protein IKC72_03210 [Clostridia bacterium]|nr:hypothetical protein [Clostridia bacterium]
MKKLVSLFVVISLLISVFSFSGCGNTCVHQTVKTSTATCTSAGVETTSCSKCNEIFSTKEVAALGHLYSVRHDDNVKCKNCDLLQFNFEFKGIPETITIYEERNVNTGGTETVKTLELEVGEVKWFVDKADQRRVRFEIPVTITYVLDERTETYVAGQYKVNGDESTGDDWTRLSIQVPKVGQTDLIFKEFSIDDITQQYTYEVNVYETMTYTRRYGTHKILSYTFAS